MDGVHVFYVTRVVKGGDTPGALASRDVVLLPVRQYAYCTAAGRAMMSRMGGAEVDRILALSPLRKFTNATLTDPDEIRRLLDVYQKGGKCWPGRTGRSSRTSSAWPPPSSARAGRRWRRW